MFLLLLSLLLSRYISINIIIILSFIIRTIRFLLKIFWWYTCRPSWARAGSECRYVDPVLAWHSSPGGHVVFTLHSRPNMYILISISNIASKWTFQFYFDYKILLSKFLAKYCVNIKITSIFSWDIKKILTKNYFIKATILYISKNKKNKIK